MNSLVGKKCLILYNKVSSDDVKAVGFNSRATVRDDVVLIKKILSSFGVFVRTLGIERINGGIVSKIKEKKPDAVFNLCEGLYFQSEPEIYVAGLLELLGVSYTGSPPIALGLALNKARCQNILRHAGIRVPHSTIGLAGKDIDFKNVLFPVIVKPLREDGSAGISERSVVATPDEARALVEEIDREYKGPSLIEEFIEGREVTVPLIGNPPVVLGIGEIDFSGVPRQNPRIISYQGKWDEKSGIQVVFPAKVSKSEKKQIERFAVSAFEILGCRDYARIDMRIDADERVYVIDVNTNPQLLPDAGFGDAARIANGSFEKVVAEIFSEAVKRSKNAV